MGQKEGFSNPRILTPKSLIKQLDAKLVVFWQLQYFKSVSF